MVVMLLVLCLMSIWCGWRGCRFFDVWVFEFVDGVFVLVGLGFCVDWDCVCCVFFVVCGGFVVFGV